METRRVTEKRLVTFTLKLTEQEAEDLRWLAERRFRRTGDEVRRLINVAVAEERKEHVDGGGPAHRMGAVEGVSTRHG